MAEEGDAYGDTNGLETTPEGVCDVSTEKRHDVDPEGVEGGETCRSLLTEPKGTGLAVLATCSSM